MYKTHHNCRVCGSIRLKKYIDLGMLPLSNNLCDNVYESSPRFPLQVMLCQDCGLSQLSVVVDPNILFGHYVYRSSINKGYVEHCRRMAVDLKERYCLNKDSFMVDIAGNDGALLLEFKSEIGLSILNIDPAVNLSTICHAKGVPTLNKFWGKDVGIGVSMVDYRTKVYSKSRETEPQDNRADLITATNVFAHVDDVFDFMEGVKAAMKPTGVLVLEFPYLIDFIENNEFDTIYFEHLSYFSITPLWRLCQKVGLNVMRVEKHAIHGGTVRVHIGYGHPDETVDQFLHHEETLTDKTYQDFNAASFKAIYQFRDTLNLLKNKGFKIAGFAASAKGNTLLNCAGVTCGTMDYIIDETPEKIGKYSPGTHIPIVSILDMGKPDYIVILSWNFADEIMKKLRGVGYEGQFIIPIPEFKIVDDCSNAVTIIKEEHVEIKPPYFTE